MPISIGAIVDINGPVRLAINSAISCSTLASSASTAFVVIVDAMDGGVVPLDNISISIVVDISVVSVVGTNVVVDANVVDGTISIDGTDAIVIVVGIGIGIIPSVVVIPVGCQHGSMALAGTSIISNVKKFGTFTSTMTRVVSTARMAVKRSVISGVVGPVVAL